jgi:hypothetical protein
MRCILSVFFALATFFAAAPAVAQTTPGPTSYDVEVSGEEAVQYARQIESDVAALESMLLTLKGRIPANLSSRLAAEETGLRELRAAAQAPGSAPADLEARLTALGEAVAALPTDTKLDAWKQRFETSAATWRAEIEQRLRTLAAASDQARADITALKADVAALKAAGGRQWWMAVSAETRFALHPGHYPSAVLSTPDNGGGGLSLEFLVPIATQRGYAFFCPGAAGGYASGRTAYWRVEAAYCAGWRGSSVDGGLRLGLAYSGNVLGVGRSDLDGTQVGDFHGVLADVGGQITPQNSPFYASFGVRAGAGIVRLDQSGSLPIWSAGVPRLEPYLQLGAIF